MEETTTVGPKMVPTAKRKSIFTDIVHLAGLDESKKIHTRETAVDLRTTKQSSMLQSDYRSPITDHLINRPDFSAINGNIHRKASSISSLIDRSRSFNAFLSPSFFATEPFPPPLLPSPHALHDFLPTVFAGQPGSGVIPVCWAAGYGHSATSIVPSLSLPQFAPMPFNLAPTVDVAAREPCQVQNSMSGVGSAKLPSSLASTSSTRNKQAPRFQCPDCNRVYSTFSGLSKHRQFHCAAQLKRQFGCKFCQKHYTSLGALKMHIRTHTLPCKCDLCGKAFSRPWLLQGHVRTHTGEKPFRCLHCGRAFADRSNLRAHLQTHSDVKKYRCICCQKTFSRMSLLTKHESNGCSGIGN